MPIVERQFGGPSSPRGYALDLVNVTGNLTLSANYIDCILQVNSASDVTITLPNDLPPGFHCLVEQSGAGKAIFAVASGATKANRQSFDRTAGQYAVMGAYVRSNPILRQASWVLTGDGAAA